MSDRKKDLNALLNVSVPTAPRDETEVQIRLQAAVLRKEAELQLQETQDRERTSSRTTGVSEAEPQRAGSVRPTGTDVVGVPADLELAKPTPASAKEASTGSTIVDLQRALRHLKDLRSAAMAQYEELQSLIASARDDAGLVRASANAAGELVGLEINERARTQPLRIGALVVIAVNRARAAAGEIGRQATSECAKDMPDLVALRRLELDFEEDLKRSPVSERADGRPDGVVAALETARSLAQWKQEFDNMRLSFEIGAGIGYVRISGRDGQLQVEINRDAIRHITAERLSEYVLNAVRQGEATLKQHREESLGTIQTVYSPLSFWLEEFN